jgi:DNA-directed RNA polymerase subunit RPC12/RpoP
MSARKRTKPILGIKSDDATSKQYVCTNCDANDREHGYAVFSFWSTTPADKMVCPQCGATLVVEGAASATTGLIPEPGDHKFRRIASRRVSKALQAIEALGNLASAQYTKTPDDINNMFNALVNHPLSGINAVKAKFSATRQSKEKTTFTM